MIKKVKCIKCCEDASKIIDENGVKIPLCQRHYNEFIEEEEYFIDNVENIEEED